jgi:hypothetical protein
MISSIIKKSILFGVLGLAFFWSITKADTQIKTLFNMSCEITRIPVSWVPAKTIFAPNQYTDELAALTKKWYNRIDLIKEFIYNGKTIKILLGEKCDLPVLRINQEESVNDIWVDHIEHRWNKLVMYWAKDWFATLISCDLSTLQWNVYIPFEKSQKSTWEKIHQTPLNNTIPTKLQISSPAKVSLPLSLEKKILHPQDAFFLRDKPVSEIITIFDGNWKRDRKELAAKLNIKNYKGTKAQNIQIRNYLISYITIQVEVIETAEIQVSEQEYKRSQTKVVSELAKMRWYSRKYDRWALFQEIGENILLYKWTRAQNLKIRSYLLTKTQPKP